MSTLAVNVAVLQTYWVGHPGSHAEIHLAAVDDRRPLQSARCGCLITVTQDETLYTRALDAEGDMGRRFDATWRTARRQNGRSCQVLEQLVERCAQKRTGRFEFGRHVPKASYEWSTDLALID